MSVETVADRHLARAREFLNDSIKELVTVIFDHYKEFGKQHVEEMEDALMAMRKAQRLLD